ncbi:hypothetical protein Taro_029471 [Colocasia esculenta]|uniref:Uncharacterized protein n=1 Tax=Colocasia esculenta TaxID=4460 RepID=A0A843VDW7_COLES|nr:hypothetical protein [Colocasia esculenta]
MFDYVAILNRGLIALFHPDRAEELCPGEGGAAVELLRRLSVSGGLCGVGSTRVWRPECGRSGDVEFLAFFGLVQFFCVGYPRFCVSQVPVPFVGSFVLWYVVYQPL